MEEMEILRMLAGPLIGAVIGYCTNYIAVKMLFRPYHPVKLCGRTLPFTPGIIPKRQPDLAKAVGKAVGENLFGEEEIKKIQSEIKDIENIKAQADKFVGNLKSILV